jgi:hypothetical protein
MGRQSYSDRNGNHFTSGRNGDSPSVNTVQRIFPELSPEALCGPIGEIVQVIEPHTEAHPAAVLIQLLAGFGSLIGSSPYAMGDAEHPAVIFATIVGQSSKSRKGTSWQPAKAVLKEIDPAWFENRVVSGLASGEGIIHAVRDPVYGFCPKEKKEVMKDPGVDDKRLFVHESEFAQGLAAMGRKDSILSPVIRSAWDDGKLSSLTKLNPSKATHAHVSIVTHITQEELQRQLHTCEFFNGFANRFLWLITKRMRILPFGGKFTAALVANQIEALKKAVLAARQGGEVTRSQEARSEWAKGYEHLSRARSGRAGVVCDRAEAQVLRLSLIYALSEGSFIIELSHHEAAMAVWQYCEESAKYIFGDEPANPHASKIIDALREAAPEGITRTEISETIFRRNLTATQLSDALTTLHDAKLATRKIEHGAGRPIERWYSTN